jgi:hypothetical protein
MIFHGTVQSEQSRSINPKVQRCSKLSSRIVTVPFKPRSGTTDCCSLDAHRLVHTGHAKDDRTRISDYKPIYGTGRRIEEL